MRRREFFRALSLAVAAGVVDPETWLWTPGAKTIFVPPLVGWVRDIHMRCIVEFTPNKLDMIFGMPTAQVDPGRWIADVNTYPI